MPSNASVHMQNLRPIPGRSRQWTRCLGVLGVTASLGLGMISCQKTALRPDDNRSQFDRYDQSRSQRAEPFLEDEFGRRTPNLAERLLDRDR